MKVYSILLFSLIVSCSAKQPEEKEVDSWSVRDSMLIRGVESAVNKSVIEVAKVFLGTPYVAKILEKGDDYSTIVNLHEVDCTTFVENLLAIKNIKDFSKQGVAEMLERLRYRAGNANGYTSRLHYFTDWIRVNEQKGFFVDITKRLGGIATQKHINFMSQHRSKYERLKSKTSFEAIKDLEIELSARTYYVIPKSQIQLIAPRIKDGDIIAITTSVKGLDVIHVGMAVKDVHTRKLHLLHASSVEGKVVISKKTLFEYLQANRLQEGIMVLRLQK